MDSATPAPAPAAAPVPEPVDVNPIDVKQVETVEPSTATPSELLAADPVSYASACVIPTSWTALPVLSIAVYSHDTSVFTFGLPGGGAGGEGCLGLPACACLLALAPGADHDGSDAVRPYTPISPGDKKGSFDLLIKRYDQWGEKCPPDSIFAFFSYNVKPHAYKPKGAMSNHIFNLKVGDTLQVLIIFILLSLFTYYANYLFFYHSSDTFNKI
jgi:hypothetical protein